MTYKIQIPVNIELKLDRILIVLDRLNRPQKSVPPVIHVAGTNGKGSTIAFLKAILEGEGKIVHAYTSPHLIQVNERIYLGGQLITDKFFSELLAEVRVHAHDVELSYFEEITCVAFLAFSRVPADYVLLEVGLGGRLDATNVVDPIVSVITSISLDHQEYLGQTVDLIAREKAGIIKPGKPVVLARQPFPEVYPLIEEIARFHGSSFVRSVEIPMVNLGFVGDHQRDNAATAITVTRLVLGEGDYTHHLRNAQWPGRMQQVSVAPDIWLDGAHNIDGIQAAATQIRRWKNEGKRLIICFAQLVNRSHDILLPVLDLADEIIHIDMNQRDRFHPKPANIKKSFTPEQALSHFQQDAYNNSRILFLGSLYMVGEVLNVWEKTYGCNK